MIKNELIEKAKEAMKNAYAPYSGFKVGAALLSENGKEIKEYSFSDIFPLKFELR